MVSRACDEACRFEAALNRLVGVGEEAASMHHNESGNNAHDRLRNMNSRRPRSPGDQMPPPLGGPHSTRHRQQVGKGGGRGREQRVLPPANRSDYYGQHEATVARTSSPHHRSHPRSSEREWQSHQSHSNYHRYAQEQQHYPRYYMDDEPSFYEEDYQKYQRNAYDRDMNRWSSGSQYSSDRGHSHGHDGVSTAADDKAIQRRRARERRDQEERHRRWIQEAKVKEEQEKEFLRYEQAQRVRKEEQERARKEQEQAEAERKQRRQTAENRAEYEKKIAELVRPAGIPKPPPPLHEPQRLPSNPSPRWAETAAAAAATATAIKGSEDPSETSTKVSWEPPYSYWSSTSEEQTVGKPLHLCKTSSSHSDLEKKLSSHHSSSSPKKLPPSSVHLKSSVHSSTKDSSRVGAFAEKPTPVCLVEIEPDFFLPLRGSAETLRAVETGCVLPTLCMACSASLIVKDDCDYVICPSCRVVCPVDGGVGTMQFVGLGMLL